MRGYAGSRADLRHRGRPFVSQRASPVASWEGEQELAGGEGEGWQQLLELEARLGSVHATNTTLRSRLNGFDSDGEDSDEQAGSPVRRRSASPTGWRASPFVSGAPAVDVDVRRVADHLDDLGGVQADGWGHLQTGSAGQQLSTYLELFEKEDMPEPAALVGSDRAWLLNKYGELRYKHRELFVRCELVGEENRSCTRENGRLQHQVSALQRQLADTRHITTDQSSMLRQCEEQLTMVKALEQKEAKQRGVDLTDKPLYTWTASELAIVEQKLREADDTIRRLQTKIETSKASAGQQTQSLQGEVERLAANLNETRASADEKAEQLASQTRAAQRLELELSSSKHQVEDLTTQLANLRAQSEQQLEEQQTRLEAQATNQTELHASELVRLRQQHEHEMDELRARHANEMEVLHARHANEMDSTKSLARADAAADGFRNNARVSELQDELDTAVRAKEAAEKELARRHAVAEAEGKALEHVMAALGGETPQNDSLTPTAIEGHAAWGEEYAALPGQSSRGLWHRGVAATSLLGVRSDSRDSDWGGYDRSPSPVPSSHVSTQHTTSAAVTSPNSPTGRGGCASPFGAVVSSKFAELHGQSSALKHELHEHQRHMTHQEQAQARLNHALETLATHADKDVDDLYLRENLLQHEVTESLAEMAACQDMAVQRAARRRQIAGLHAICQMLDDRVARNPSRETLLQVTRDYKAQEAIAQRNVDQCRQKSSEDTPANIRLHKVSGELYGLSLCTFLRHKGQFKQIQSQLEQNLLVAKNEARSAEASAVIAQKVKDELAAVQAILTHLSSYAESQVSAEKVQYNLANLKQEARAAESALGHTAEGARRHEVASQKLREKLGALQFVRKARANNLGDVNALRATKRIDLHEAIVLSAARSGAMQSHSAAWLLFNRTTGTTELLDELLHAPVASARQILQARGTQARQQHDSAKSMLKHLDDLESELLLAEDSMHRATGFTKLASSSAHESLMVGEKQAELVKVSRTVEELRQDVKRLKMRRREAEVWSGKLSMVSILIPVLSWLEDFSTALDDDWTARLSGFAQQNNSTRRYASYLLDASKGPVEEQKDLHRQKHLLMGQLDVVQTQDRLSTDEILRELYEDLRVHASTAGAKKSASAGAHQQFMSARSQMQALQQVPDFVARDLRSLPAGSPLRALKSRLTDQEMALRRQLKGHQETVLECDRAQREWHQQAYAMDEIRKLCPDAIHIFSTEVLKKQRSLAVSSQAAYERIKSRTTVVDETRDRLAETVVQLRFLESLGSVMPSQEGVERRLLGVQHEVASLQLSCCMTETFSKRFEHEALVVDSAVGALKVLSSLGKAFVPESRALQKVYETIELAAPECVAGQGASVRAVTTDRELQQLSGSMSVAAELRDSIDAHGDEDLDTAMSRIYESALTEQQSAARQHGHDDDVNTALEKMKQAKKRLQHAQVAASGVQEGAEHVRYPAVPAGYFTVPPIYDLQERPTAALEKVKDFAIGKRDTFLVQWDVPGHNETCVAGLDVTDILLHHGGAGCCSSVELYPEGSLKPAVGVALNKPATITLWTKKGQDPDRMRRRISSNKDTRFLSYVPDEGRVVFRVDHFSKYGLGDDDDDEEDPIVDILRIPSHRRTDSELGVLYNLVNDLDHIRKSATTSKIKLEVCRRLELVSAGRGEAVIEQGDQNDAFFILVAGQVAKYCDGTEIGRLEAGATFGELVLQGDDHQCTASIVATRQCSLARLSTEDWKTAVGTATERDAGTHQRELEQAGERMRMAESEYKRIKGANERYHVAAGRLKTLQELKTAVATSVSPKHRPPELSIPQQPDATPFATPRPSAPLLQTSSSQSSLSTLEALEQLLQKLLQDEVLLQSPGHSKLIALIKQLFAMLHQKKTIETSATAQKNKAIDKYIKQMRNLLLFRCLTTWKNSVTDTKAQQMLCAQRKQREAVIVDRMVARRMQRDLLKALKAWRSLVINGRALQLAARRVMARFLRTDLAAAWNGWVEHVEEKKKLNTAAQRVMARFLKADLTAAWN
eukprot:COSAG02_NODE_1860_length_10613_cov_40.769831_1_plen_2020_part_10